MPPPSLPTRTNVHICTTLPGCFKIITIIIIDNLYEDYIYIIPPSQLLPQTIPVSLAPSQILIS